MMKQRNKPSANDSQKARLTKQTNVRSLRSSLIAVLFVVCVLIALMGFIIMNNSIFEIISLNGEIASDTVKFNDPCLEKAVCQAMGIREAPIKLKDAVKVKSLDLSCGEDSRAQITDLTGLSSFVLLEELNLADNRISDVSELSNLKNLKYLHLEDNLISDIDPLASLTNLRLLDLEGNEISNIYALKDLTELTVSDISAISNMKKLKELYIRNNYIVDITALEDLDEITYLSMGENNIEDINATKNMKNLTHLIICANKLTDISVIRNSLNLFIWKYKATGSKITHH